MLNLNWEKIHSIILFVTCHGLRNFPLLIHIPLYPFMNCWNPTSYYFLSLSFDPPHPYPTPPLHDPPHPTPPLHDPPHPTPIWHTPPTPPLHEPPTPPHPTPHPFMNHPPHPFMNHPPHPTPQPQNKGQGMLWGQTYVLPMTCRGAGGIGGPPFGRHAALRLFYLLNFTYRSGNLYSKKINVF